MRDGTCGRSKVLVAEAHPLTRSGLLALLSAEPDLTVCGEADTAADVRRLARSLRPDLVILDLDLPGGDGFALLEELRSRPEPPRVLIFAGNGLSDDAAERALRLGAAAFVSKRVHADEFLQVTRSVLAGQIVLGDALIQRLVRQRVGGRKPAVGVARRRIAT